jgi:hypothetical protein
LITLLEKKKFKNLFRPRLGLAQPITPLDEEDGI